MKTIHRASERNSFLGQISNFREIIILHIPSTFYDSNIYHWGNANKYICRRLLNCKYLLYYAVCEKHILNYNNIAGNELFQHLSILGSLLRANVSVV